MEEISQFYEKVKNVKVRETFLKKNLLYEFEDKIIQSTLSCSFTLRQNSIFVLDHEHNLIEFDTVRKRKIKYINKCPLPYIHDLIYDDSYGM